MPPSCIRMSRTALPKGVKKLAVSLTISPVTHTAEVAVKIASIGERVSLCENGKERSIVPVTIIIKYPEIISLNGLTGRKGALQIIPKPFDYSIKESISCPVVYY